MNNNNMNTMEQLFYIVSEQRQTETSSMNAIHSNKNNQILQQMQVVAINTVQPQTIVTHSNQQQQQQQQMQQSQQIQQSLLQLQLQPQQLNPRLSAGLKKYNETLSLLEMRASEKHTEIAVESAKKAQAIRHQRQQYHLQIENKKNIQLSHVYNQFAAWIKQMKNAANMVNNANKHFQQQRSQQCQSSQPMTFILSDIPSTTTSNGNNDNNDNNNNNDGNQNGFMSFSCRSSNVPQLRSNHDSNDPNVNTGLFKKEKQ